MLTRHPSAAARRARLLVTVAAAALVLSVVPTANAGAPSLAGGAVGSTPRSMDAPKEAPAAPTGPNGNPALDVDPILSGYSSPLAIANTGANNTRIFIVEQTGKIRIASRDSGTWKKISTFLDIRTSIRCCGEEGLLGLAFHPEYATNGRFYVNFTRAGDGANVIAEYRRMTIDKANPNSKRVLLVIPTIYENHNGGTLQFGPDDYLYIGNGDGGSSGDPGERAQDLTTLLGKLLRIDPIDPDGNGPRKYRIPPDNPYVGVAGKDAIWSLGLRNPWKFSFDRATGDLWLADVGQDDWEEVDHRPTGRADNFGWDEVEGFHDYPGGGICSSNCHVLPIAEYSQSGGRCSVTGGYVYRGPDYASLVGRYVFGDYCTGEIWDIPEGFSGGALPSPLNTSANISSFGEDSAGRLFMTSLGGTIYRVDVQ